MKPVALVVDDSMLIRHAVCRFLEERGFAVESATNGREALEMLAALQPGLIVTDVQMPKMSGTELISALKASPRTAGIPIVVLTSLTGGAQPRGLGFYHVVCKDIDIEAELARALDQLSAVEA